MARKGKIGLDYFSHDTEFDNELEYIIAVHRELGYYVYFRLLERLYKFYGYYYPADKKSLALLGSKINVDIESLNVIINDCLGEHLFDKCIHKKYEILTSTGIQKRFFEAIKRRNEVEIIKEYILLNNVDIKSYNVNINWLNVDISTQSKVKDSKVKDSKEIIYPWTENEFIEVWEFWKKYQKEQFRFTYKPIGEQGVLSRLKELSDGNLGTAMLIIKQSIQSGWKGLFELKGKFKTQQYDREQIFNDLRQS